MAEGSGDKNDGRGGGDWLSPWIGRAGGLALLLTAWLGAIFPGRKVQPFAYTGAAILTVAYAIYLYWRGRHRPPPLPPPLPPLETSLLRSFLPFEQGDTLIGRRSDVADAMAILQGTEFRFGVIWGESGCGKTSFLRAGLVPELRRRGHTPIYLSRPTKDPVEAIERALDQITSASRAFVIIDQFEEYFLTHANHNVTGALGKRMQKVLEEHQLCSLVIAIRRDFFARLQNFAPDIADPTSPRTTFELANLRTPAARDVLVQAAADETVQFETTLIDAVIEDLETDGEVWPVELQLIGTRLKRARVRQKAVYVALGRKSGVIGTFIRDEVAHLPKPILGEIVLRKLCAPGGIAKSPVDITLDAIAEDVRARDMTLMAGTELATCIKKLQEARIIIQTGDDTFNLTHDALAPLIQRGTTGLQGGTEAADRSISFYLGAFRNDRRVRIPIRTLLQIRRHATPQTLSDNLVRELITKSWHSAAFAVSGPAAVAILVLVGYAAAIGSWSIGTAPAALALAPPSIVIRSGSPFTRLLPGMDRVNVETSLGVDQLDSMNATATAQVPRGEIWGFGSMQQAVVRIANVLKPLERIAFLRIAGQPTAAAAAFATTVSLGEQNAFALKAASDAIGLTGRADGDEVTDEVTEALIRTTGAASSAGLPAKLAANVGLLRIAENRVGISNQVALTLPQALAILDQQIVGLDLVTSSWKLALVKATINQLLLNGMSQPRESDLRALELILDNPKNDPLVRTSLLNFFESYAARNENLAVPALQYLLSVTLTKTDDWSTRGAVNTIQILARNHPHALQHPFVTELLTSPRGLVSPENKTIDSWGIPLSLVGRVNPTALPATFAKNLQTRVDDSKTPARTRAIASIALSHLAAADPRLRNAQTKHRVVDLLRESVANSTPSLRSLQRQAASAAADLAAAGQLDTESVQVTLHSLGRILTNREFAEFAFRDFWGNDGLDADLKRLVSAGGQVDARTLDPIVDAIAQPSVNGGESEAAEMLIVAAKASPQEVLKRQSKLDSSRSPTGLQDFDRPLSLKVLAAFGQADAAMGSTNEQLKRCESLLATQRNTRAWQRGAFCAFFVALDNPAALPQLKTYLADLQGRGVAQRMAARMTLEMLVDVQRVKDARSNRALAPMTRARLRYDLGDRETHVAIAARAALLALDADTP